MKKSFLILGMMLLSGVYALAASTTDRFVVSCDEVLLPGADGEEPYVCVNVGIDGATIYSCYNLDIQFPEGVEPYEEDGDYWVIMDEDGIYPFTKKAGKKIFTHSLSFNYGTIDGKERCLRIACTSSENAVFTDTSGSLLYIYVKASGYAKPGSLKLKFSGQALGEKVEDNIVKYVPEDFTDQTVQISSTCKVPLSVNATNKWSTCILPFDAALPTGVQAYTTNSKKSEADGDYLVLSPAASIAAYTPYILYSEEGYSGTLQGTVDASKYPEAGYVTEGFLNGAITPQEKNAGYVLQNLNSEGVKFYSMYPNTFTIPAGKCWATISVVSGAKPLGIAIDDESNVQTIAASKQENVPYTLDGKKAAKTRAGQIYIMNGQKVLKIK